MHTFHDTKLHPDIGKAEKWEAKRLVFINFRAIKEYNLLMPQKAWLLNFNYKYH